MASNDSDTSQDRPYQVVIFVGSEAPTMPDVKVVDLTVSESVLPPAASAAPPADATAELAAAFGDAPDAEPADAAVSAEPTPDHPVLARLRASGLTPADLRSRVLFLLTGDADAYNAVAAYAAMVSFAGRRIDAACGTTRIEADALDARTRSVAASEAATATLDHIQVGAPHAQLPSAGISGSLSAEEVELVRAARRVRLVPPAEPLAAVAQFVVVAALRARGESDRFPFLVAGDEPAPAEGDESAPVGLDLDSLRRSAVELRRSLRSEDRSQIAPKVELTARQRTLLAAAARPVEATMTALGASTPDGELWHCPRPQRHSNGDANASMRVAKGKARCFRCDPERVDSLRLVMDVRGCTADEAADWLLANVEALPAEALGGFASGDEQVATPAS